MEKRFHINNPNVVSRSKTEDIITMHVVVFTKIAFLPVRGGEHIRSLGMIKAIAGAAELVTVICPLPVDYEKELPKNVRIVKCAFGKAHQLFPFYVQRKHKQLISAIHKNNPISVGVIDYAFFGQYINYFKGLGAYTIYGTHNAQANLVKQRRFRIIFWSVVNQVYYHIVRLHEKIYFHRADRLIVVSNDDASYHRSLVEEESIVILPNFLDESVYIPFLSIPKRENTIVFSGNFNSFQNIEGLRWFLEEVWNSDLWQDLDLLLVGIGSEKVLKNLGMEHLPGIRATGEVESTLSYIRSARLCIVPLLHGSGTRLKCLEAMALKTQLITTSLGIEGIDHEKSVRVVDDGVHFRKSILEFFRGEFDTTNLAYEVYLSKYSLKACSELLIRTLDDRKVNGEKKSKYN